MVSQSDVRDALEGVMDPELHKSLIELGMVREIRIDGGHVDIVVALTMLACPLKDQITREVKAAVGVLEGVEEVAVELAEMTDDEKRSIGFGAPEKGSAEDLNDIRHVIAVMSGKGGVGKSMVSGLLAIALRREGHLVGILDADVTGPSIPKMFFPRKPRLAGGPMGVIPPKTKTGIQVMSINLILEDEGTAVIWRGPIVSGVIKQFWGDTFWGKLDYLIVDLPPGTSDAALTVLQNLPTSGIVLVSSPQDLAGMVVRKAADMAQQMGTPILGLIENMSYFACPDTGKRYELFGPSHAEETAKRIGVPLLGRLPIDPEIARLCDAGQIEQYPATDFAPIARELAARIPETPRPDA